jgi:hypothetical protein
VREEHLVAVSLLPAEQELQAESDRWKVNQTAVNVAQLNAAAGNPVDARLHLIDRRPNAHLENGATRQRVTKGRVKVGRLQLILIGAAWQSAHALKAPEAEQVVFHALQLNALITEEGDDRA